VTHLRTSKLVAIAVLICGTLTVLALSPFAGADEPVAESFEGECELSGVIRHQPPLTQAPASTNVHGSFNGVCSGEFTDRHGHTRQLDDAPAAYDARGVGQLSCLGGTATGTGSLRFAGTGAIRFSLTERRPAPGVATVVLEGAGGGSATVLGTVSQSEDPLELNERCNGSGLRVVHGDAHVVSPGISG
jgi:hypothetical protein